MLNYHHIVLYLLCLNEAASVSSMKLSQYHTLFKDFYVESIKILYPHSRLYSANVSLKRSGHENPKIYSEIDLFDALSNYEGEIKLYYSPLGNQRYMLLPYRLERQSVCDSLENKGVYQVVRSLQNYSNVPLPVDKNVQFCELLTQGHYYIHNFMIDKSIFPTITPTGRYRLVVFAYEGKKKEVVQSVEYITTFV